MKLSELYVRIYGRKNAILPGNGRKNFLGETAFELILEGQLGFNWEAIGGTGLQHSRATVSVSVWNAFHPSPQFFRAYAPISVGLPWPADLKWYPTILPSPSMLYLHSTCLLSSNLSLMKAEMLVCFVCSCVPGTARRRVLGNVVGTQYFLNWIHPDKE